MRTDKDEAFPLSNGKEYALLYTTLCGGVTTGFVFIASASAIEVDYFTIEHTTVN